MSLLETEHRLQLGDARSLEAIAEASVDLVLTSPPYPMIEMWDEAFSSMAESFQSALAEQDGEGAFEAAHRELDRVWSACFRVLKPGGIACVNIGDATRTIGGAFRIFPNHARILMAAQAAGFTPLPDILWRKPTNAPNKFMGSGMLPAGAYVTYEHEYVLVLRKGGKREFATVEEKERRRRSAYFWEERNSWFSDLWFDLRGTTQELGDREARDRSAAFPFELAHRLISMYSVQGDLVLDPFGGTGTTAVAALAAARNSITIEIEASLLEEARRNIRASLELGAARARKRLRDHQDFTRDRIAAGKLPKHKNGPHGFPVVTSQERDLLILEPTSIEARDGDDIVARHDQARLVPEEEQAGLFADS